MKTEVKVGRGCGWIRVIISPGKVGTLVYLNKTTEVSDVARDLLLSSEYTIWIQLGGGEPRPLLRSERPLEIQEEFLSALGYTESSRRARLGIDPDLRYLIAFLTGPKWYCRSGEVWVLKGLVLPQWRKREVSLRQGHILIQPSEAGGREESGKVCGCEEGAWPRGGRHVLKVITPARSVYLGMEELWQRSLWASWAAQEEHREAGDMSGLGLTEVGPELLDLKGRLDLSRNQLSGELPALSASYISVADNRLSSIVVQPSARVLDLAGNRLHQLPHAIGNSSGLEELRLDRNLLSSMPVGSYRNLKVLSAVNNRLSELPNFLAMTETQHILQDIEEDDEKPEKLQSVNLRGNSLKGTIILGNYGPFLPPPAHDNGAELGLQQYQEFRYSSQ